MARMASKGEVGTVPVDGEIRVLSLSSSSSTPGTQSACALAELLRDSTTASANHQCFISNDHLWAAFARFCCLRPAVCRVALWPSPEALAKAGLRACRAPVEPSNRAADRSSCEPGGHRPPGPGAVFVCKAKRRHWMKMDRGDRTLGFGNIYILRRVPVASVPCC